MTMHSLPMVIEPLSAITCAPKRIRQPVPTVTLPQMTAFGATYASVSIQGECPKCLSSILHLTRTRSATATVAELCYNLPSSSLHLQDFSPGSRWLHCMIRCLGSQAQLTPLGHAGAECRK